MTNLNLFGHELVVDNFAGGGGASEGIEQALGRPVDLAINHDATAIAVHTANHPDSYHSVADVWDIDPEQAAQGIPVGLAWFSPDCRHHSKAKGSRPVSKSVRGLAWVAARWAAKVKPRVIALENVEEFLDWGPLIKDADGKLRPDPARKGQTFRGFVRTLKRHGYEVDWRILRACDYGTPTIRKRLFLIARRDGLPIKWPKPTHADPASPAVRRGKIQPWRTAAECIDWSLPCPSIFGRERPLADSTMKRIARGIQRFVIDAEQPFIVTCNHGGDRFRGQSLLEPMKTITAAHDAHGIVVPTLVQTGYSERPGQKPRSLDLHRPLGTVVAGGQKHALVTPHITKFRSGAVGHGCDEPMHTITANSNADNSTSNPGGAAPIGLVSATICREFGSSIGHAADMPLGTITAGGGGKSALVSAFLAKHFTGVIGADLRNPVPTVTTTDHNALVAASVVNLKGSNRGGRDPRQPMPTVCAGGTHAAAVAAFLAPYTGGDGVSPVTVMIDSELYVITDIGMRMLQPHELAMAQGFPASYQFAHINGKPVPKYKQVRLIGNSVCPPLARAIVEANFTHERRFMPAPAERSAA